MKRMKLLTLAVALAMVSMPAFAQRQMPGPPSDDRQRDAGGIAPDQGRGGPPPAERRDEVRKKIEALRIWRLTEELDLDEKTAAKFLPAIGVISQKRNELMRENMEAQRELRLYLEAARPDEKKIKAALDRLEKNQHELSKLQEKEIEATKDHLTVEQQARYFLFQQDFQREMREMISGARDGMGPQGLRGQGQRGPAIQRGQDQRDLPGPGGNQRPDGPMYQGPGGDARPPMRR